MTTEAAATPPAATPPALPTELTKQYINGEWVNSTQSKTLDVIDSNTATVIAKVPDGNAEDMNAACDAARAAFDDWAALPLATRKEYVEKIVDNYKAKKDQVIYWITKELGCTKFFATYVQFMMFEAHFKTALEAIDAVNMVEKVGNAVVVREPVGVVGAITPWNYPLNQVSLKVGPALLSGCTVVLKPSELTPIHIYLFAQAVHEAGLPKGVFNMVMGRGECVGEAMSVHKEVDLISFTGSTRAGIAITKAAADTLKQVKTELGGKSAAVVLDDANFAEVVPKFVGQVMNNSGQSCNALTRMLVPKGKAEEIIAIAKAEVDKVVVGKSDDAKTTIGPLVSQLQWDRVQALVEKGIKEGATVVTGGAGKPEGLQDGYFAKPTIFSNVDNKMSIAQEEIFGPVISIISYETEEEAIKIANDTVYGLNNAVASSDPERAMKVAMKLRSGMVMFNNTNMDFTAPFGGYKQSGNAREWGKAGIDEFFITKTLNGEVPASVVAAASDPEAAKKGCVVM